METNWCNPPWPLLALVVDKLRWINAKAVLVTPDWPSAIWMPTLRALASAAVVLKQTNDLYVRERRNPRTSLPPPRWRTIIWFIRLTPKFAELAPLGQPIELGSQMPA